MKLHIGRLYWPEVTVAKKIETQKTFSVRENEILVVGGGISGAIIAYRLSKEGANVTLIEQNKVGSGSSAANTGLIQYMSDEGLRYYEEKIGKDDAIFFYNESKNAISTLTKINLELEELETKTFRVENSLILATEEDKVGEIIEEVDEQKSRGYKTEYLDDKELEKRNIDAFGALLAKPDISLNPYGFINRLLISAVTNYHLNILEDTQFLDFDEEKDSLLVKARNQEGEIEASFNKIVFATGYNPPPFVLEEMKNVEINKTYVCVTEQKVDLNMGERFLVWEMKDPYTYFKYTFEDRVMIGGMDVEESTLTQEDAKKNSGKLIELTKDMLKSDDDMTCEFSYAALFGESKDDLPYMGILPDNENVFVVCGVGGNGTVYSTIASEIALKWARGEDISNYEIFRLGR